MKRVSILLATGFEEIEALAPLDVLRRLNYDVELISMTNSYYVKSSHGVDIKADKLFDKIKKLRTSNLSDKKSEMSEGNIIFKCLRRLDYIEKLNNIIIDGYNKLNSLP